MSKSRGTTDERGYGAAHQRERRRYVDAVNRGLEYCRRCKLMIPPAGVGRCPKCGKNHRGWDLGHSDRDRSVWTGPEHVCCNRATAGRRLHRAVRRVIRRTTREW